MLYLQNVCFLCAAMYTVFLPLERDMCIEQT